MPWIYVVRCHQEKRVAGLTEGQVFACDQEEGAEDHRY